MGGSRSELRGELGARAADLGTFHPQVAFEDMRNDEMNLECCPVTKEAVESRTLRKANTEGRSRGKPPTEENKLW